jgi:hypothetical protein
MYSFIMNGHGTEPSVRRGEEMRDDENDLPIWAGKRPRDFHIEVVAEAYIQHSCSNCTSYRSFKASILYRIYRHIPVGMIY